MKKIVEWVKINGTPIKTTTPTVSSTAAQDDYKYVTVQVHYIDKIYEYKTKEHMEVGKCYKIKRNDGGWVPRQRVKVLSISDKKEGTYTKDTVEIVDVVEVPTTF